MKIFIIQITPEFCVEVQGVQAGINEYSYLVIYDSIAGPDDANPDMKSICFEARHWLFWKSMESTTGSKNL